MKLKKIDFEKEKSRKKAFGRFYSIITICFCICISALFIVSVEAAEQKSNDSISVYREGRRIIEESRLIDSVTYVPLRAFGEEMGTQSIEWDAKTKTATLKKDALTVKVTNGTSYIDASGRIFYCPTGIKNINDRLFVPIRAISKAFSYDVEWNGEKRCVLLYENSEPFVSGSRFYDQNDLYWLSRIISAEARGEPFAGKIAVGNVVINRTRSKSYPDSIYGVIFDRKHGTQFSPVSYGTIYNTPTAESVLAAKICLEGYTLSDEILFFVNPRYATSSWISKARPFAFRIGGHWFYK